MLEEDIDFDYPFHDYYWDTMRLEEREENDLKTGATIAAFESEEVEKEETEKRKKRRDKAGRFRKAGKAELEAEEDIDKVTGPEEIIETPTEKLSVGERKKKERAEKRRLQHEKENKELEQEKEALEKRRLRLEKEHIEAKEAQEKKKKESTEIKKKAGPKPVTGRMTYKKANEYIVDRFKGGAPLTISSSSYVDLYNLLLRDQKIKSGNERDVLNNLVSKTTSNDRTAGVIAALKHYGYDVPEDANVGELSYWFIRNTNRVEGEPFIPFEDAKKNFHAETIEEAKTREEQERQQRKIEKEKEKVRKRFAKQDELLKTHDFGGRRTAFQNNNSGFIINNYHKSVREVNDLYQDALESGNKVDQEKYKNMHNNLIRANMAALIGEYALAGKFDIKDKVFRHFVTQSIEDQIGVHLKKTEVLKVMDAGIEISEEWKKTGSKESYKEYVEDFFYKLMKQIRK